ncbi:hypothetical protein K504DRAFT_169684 [Pleomassaria siparia CBS 279.74]|uniref:Uncharacterized protein n=1 Tax=Pleomassaria siparia CBS 279.74 TaxID=1314801 RepID=A0A6G1JUV6_9PLEO|nr:hypothetical protein K504DRAFT_169684 [Pleomassaria siparia CBS 279.74]
MVMIICNDTYGHLVENKIILCTAFSLIYSMYCGIMGKYQLYKGERVGEPEGLESSAKLVEPKC